jgi:hypothetical protein
MMRLRIGDQVEVPLTRPRLSVGQTVVLLGQRPQRLGQHGQGIDRDAQLACPGAEDNPLDADEVAEVDQPEHLPRLIAQLIAPQVKLDLFDAIGQVGKRDLAVSA